MVFYDFFLLKLMSFVMYTHPEYLKITLWCPKHKVVSTPLVLLTPGSFSRFKSKGFDSQVLLSVVGNSPSAFANHMGHQSKIDSLFLLRTGSYAYTVSFLTPSNWLGPHGTSFETGSLNSRVLSAPWSQFQIWISPRICRNNQKRLYGYLKRLSKSHDTVTLMNPYIVAFSIYVRCLIMWGGRVYI